MDFTRKISIARLPIEFLEKHRKPNNGKQHNSRHARIAAIPPSEDDKDY